MSDLSSLTSLSSDDDFEEIPRRRVIRDRTDPFLYYDELEFKERYRFSKQTIREMLHIFGPALAPKTKRNKSITAENQLLLTLRFFATGAFQQLIGDHIGVHKSTVCRIINRVTRTIAALKPNYITMPADAEQDAVKLQFNNVRHFPGVLGAIDCTHIKIQSPGGERAELFRNRKGYFSINVQAVCDSSLRIRNIVACWPGSVHDSTIFNDCPLYVDLENGVYGNAYLLGDNGYPCKKFLLTPILNPNTQSERSYNEAHIAKRNCVERCFGVLKRRFPCLGNGIRCTLDTTLAVIVACAVLHNMAIDMHDEPIIGEIPAHALVPQDVIPVHHNRTNTAVRDALLRTTFNRA